MSKHKRTVSVNFLQNRAHYRKLQLIFLINTYLTNNWR